MNLYNACGAAGAFSFIGMDSTTVSRDVWEPVD
jgi:hypothetical protein